ncbi:MAG TPA: aminopeptidase [Bacilli bacterium]|nr:aminopeptidase [Bacilli bacterium]
MKDPRFAKLARNLIEYSVNLQPGEKVMIEVFGGEIPLARELIKAAYAVGGQPFLQLRHEKLLRELYKGATREQFELWAKMDRAYMAEMDAYIAIRMTANINELSGVPADRMAIYNELYFHPVHAQERVNNTRWCVLRYPNESMAQAANMSTEDFEDFYFDVTTLDYKKMSLAADPLKDLMDRTDKVRLVGPGETDLTFSIKDIPTLKDDGHKNIPGGECYTAPVRDSVNGVLHYNAASLYNGITFENVRFVFRDGKIVEATANDTEALNKVLDTDEGARYIGEFAIAFNPFIREPMLDILFDEKIEGSFHFTPGNAYDDADNGNRSAIHWDLVAIQREDYGGGEIWFDDVLVRKDGKFVLPELQGLNPENLK